MLSWQSSAFRLTTVPHCGPLPNLSDMNAYHSKTAKRAGVNLKDIYNVFSLSNALKYIIVLLLWVMILTRSKNMKALKIRKFYRIYLAIYLRSQGIVPVLSRS